MADQKISDFASAGQIRATDELEVRRGASNLRSTMVAVVPQIAYAFIDSSGGLDGLQRGVFEVEWNCVAEGTYSITFGDPVSAAAWFASAPVVTVTPEDGSMVAAHVVSVTATTAVIRIRDAAGVERQRAFHLHAMGAAAA